MGHLNSYEIRKSGGKTYYLRYTDDRGEQQQLRIADAEDISLGEARKAAAVLRNKIALGYDPKGEQKIRREVPTLDAFVRDSYLPYVQGYKRSWKCDESLLRNHVQKKLGHKHLDEITKADIIAIHHGRRAAGAAKGSANRLLILLRFLFNRAVEWETPGVIKNPTKGVALFDDPPTKERFMTADEVQRLYEATQQSSNKMLPYIFMILLLTGARRREVLDAKWEHFDIEQRLWYIPVTKTGKPRYIPMSGAVLELLESVPRFPNCPWAFPNMKTLKPIKSGFASWDTARKRAGLKDVRMHDIRHTFASFLVNGGRTLYEVMKLLGHTQIKTTQRYSHLAHGTLIDACDTVANSVGNFFSKKAPGLDPTQAANEPMPDLPKAA